VTGGEGRSGVLVMAHGTPARLEGLADFYTEIRRGRAPSPEQLADLAARYRAIGGTSPLNAVTAAQGRGVAAALEGRAPGRYLVEVGARFADPRIEAAVDALADAGVDDVVGVVLAPHSSGASVAHYARRAEAAAAAAGARRGRALPLVMVDHWHDAPGFAELVAARVTDTLATVAAGGGPVTVVFTAHSIPAALVDGGDTYGEQVAGSAAAVAALAGLEHWTVAWQSAGRTDEQWLGPDVGEVIADRAAAGDAAVVVCPIGFVADHLEVLYDVDVEARAAADHAGIALARSASFNDDPAFCALLADVVLAAGDGP
jgi:ferrochelatase